MEGRGPIIGLGGAQLRDVELVETDLHGANLSEADLSGANLRGAEVITNEKLEQQAGSLKEATMPNGQMYEDWLNEDRCPQRPALPSRLAIFGRRKTPHSFRGAEPFERQTTQRFYATIPVALQDLPPDVSSARVIPYYRTF